MSAVADKGSHSAEVFDPNKWINITIEGERDPVEVENEIKKPLAERVKLIRARDKTSEYLIDNLIKVSAPSEGLCLNQTRIWMPFYSWYATGMVISIFATGVAGGFVTALDKEEPFLSLFLLSIATCWLFIKACHSFSQVNMWNLRPEFVIAHARALAYQKKTQNSDGTIIFGSGKPQAFLSPREFQYLHGEKKHRIQIEESSSSMKKFFSLLSIT